MRCLNCGNENRQGAKFCDQCATPLARQSRQSSAQGLEASVQKASDLGPRTPDAERRTPGLWTPQHLADRIVAEQAAIAARGALDGERKTITVLFADIKSSMELIEDLDPEEARAIIDPVLKIMMAAIHRYEGYVAQSTGDGIFALFGAPIAHEDHPQRALYAALKMQEDMRRYSDKLRLETGMPIQIRVGLNTGEVVLRSIRTDDLHTDYTPIGYSTSLAARMESLATPGSIVVSEHTYKLTEGYFEFKPLGAARVKGVSEPVHIYEALGVGPLRTRLQVAARRGLARFIGRQGELERLQSALVQARAGHGQIVAVKGEAGVGKSRLFHEFKHTVQPDALILETFSVSLGKAHAYLPLIELLKDYFQITLQDDERKRREKITGKVLTLDRALEDILPYLFTLLRVSEPGSSLPQIDPQLRRQRTFAAIVRLFLRESYNQPLILICEDLHWIDEETQTFLSLLGEKIGTARILLLMNYRPEYPYDWGSKPHCTQVHLTPLGRKEAGELLTALLEARLGKTRVTALHALRQLILTKTEGNPFFMEEIVQTLIEEGVLEPGRHAGTRPTMSLPVDFRIPPTVQGVLTARIDRLAPEEKALLQTLAVIGKEFSLTLLVQVVEQTEEELQRLLDHLQRAEFIYQRPALPEVEYTFKHALTQEVSYSSLLLERRRGVHERTAQAIETLWSQQLEEHYSALAHHYSHSGNTHKAVQYLHQAGEQEVQRSANTEAIQHLTAALALLKDLPESPERTQKELALQIALGIPLVVTKGIASPEVGDAYNRALELFQQVGETPQLFPVLRGLWEFYEVRGALPTARKLGEQLLTSAQRTRDPSLLLVAHNVMSDTLLWFGEFASARAHAEQALALYNPEQHRSLASLYAGYDLGAACLNWTALSLWHLGYPDQALRQSQEALRLALTSSQPYSLTHTLFFVAALHQYCRQWHMVQERAESAIMLAQEHGFALYLASSTILRGWALATQGRSEEGITLMRQGMVSLRATGAEVQRPYYLALLAEGYSKAGQSEEGLVVLTEALAVGNESGERCWEAELYRLKGTLTLQKEARGWRLETSPPSSQASSLKPQVSREVEREAEECFLKAIDIARKQQAKSLELRAAMSLSRLWQSQGKRSAARHLLADIYGWFTEGFDTGDLKEAKTLLEELS